MLAVIKERGYSPQVLKVNGLACIGKICNRIFISKEEKLMPEHKVAKDWLTLLLGGNSAGNFKLKPLWFTTQKTPGL
jgi:hypothetical protein